MKSNQPFVPFLRANNDLNHLESFYGDAPFCRISLEREKWAEKLSAKHSVWIDVALDGIQQSVLNPDYSEYINKHGDLTVLKASDFLKSPKRGDIEQPIIAFLNAAKALSPYAISIPQLPHSDGVENNKTNKILFSISTEWKAATGGDIKLILPVIFTNQRQLNKKTDRNGKIAFIKGLLGKASVDGVWITDQSLEDQAGTGNFDKERFPGIVDFFKEFRAACSLNIVIAGPFWGLGLLLWSRGLASHFAIGMG
jgi:hypothetical protein